MTRTWLKCTTKRGLVCIAALVAILSTGNTALAVLLYDMEGAPPPDGFAPNGGGTSISQATTGVTEGSNSMSVSIVNGATFVGALTTDVPAALGNPPGVQAILVDLTIDTGEEFTGAFADMGVTIFETGGIPHQFADIESLGGKAAGLYPNVRFDLDDSFGQSFNEIFDTTTVSGFQLFFSKSGDAPLTVYVDNIRAIVPEPATSTVLSVVGLALCAAFRRRIR